MSLIDYFTEDHHACDETWAEVERLVDEGQAAAATAAWARFFGEMERHFTMEETVLFPAFEEATGMAGGPTQVMRMEHQQMRGLLEQMNGAAASGDLAGLVELGDTLLMIIQQHNKKEEGMLYPMCEAHVGDSWDSMHAACEAVGPKPA
ncbi:MAG: hemerythrin domain-containing protein [Planctomycetota bacterium]|nr:hemerythrin domain-containing protein [Planctomycetota bacterium]